MVLARLLNLEDLDSISANSQSQHICPDHIDNGKLDGMKNACWKYLFVISSM